jgi:hypothetical protein
VLARLLLKAIVGGNMKIKLLICFSVLLLVAAGGVLLHHIPKGEPAKTIWTKSDLSPPPPTEENGFELLNKERIPSSELPKELKEFQKKKDSSWGEVEAVSTAIHAYTTTPKALTDLALVREALGKPHFADSCEASIEGSCYLVQLVYLHNMVKFEIWRLALDNQWGEASLLLTQLLRADIELAHSSKNLMISLISVSMLTDTLRLLEGLPADRRPAVNDLLQSISEKELSLQRSFISEYIIVQQGIDKFSRSSSFWEMLVYDVDQTKQISNDYFTKLITIAAASNSQVHQLLPNLKDQSSWWLIYNMTGKRLLSASMQDYPELSRRFETEKTNLLRLRDVLVKGLKSAT